MGQAQITRTKGAARSSPVEERLSKALQNMKEKRRFTSIAQWTFLALCFVLVLGGKHPPANAQTAPSAPAEVYGLEIRANGLDRRIDQLSSGIDTLGGKQAKMWDAINANTNAESTNKGIFMGVGSLLGLLQVFTILQGMNRDKKRDEG